MSWNMGAHRSASCASGKLAAPLHFSILISEKILDVESGTTVTELKLHVRSCKVSVHCCMSVLFVSWRFLHLFVFRKLYRSS